MSDPRDQKGPEPFTSHEPDNTAGREANAARPLDKEQPTQAAPERYPSVGRDDSVEITGESRSFDPRVGAPRQGAGDEAHANTEGRTGPEADPAEGKRD